MGRKFERDVMDVAADFPKRALALLQNNGI
jgi:hypothetical protein